MSSPKDKIYHIALSFYIENPSHSICQLRETIDSEIIKNYKNIRNKSKVKIRNEVIHELKTASLPHILTNFYYTHKFIVTHENNKNILLCVYKHINSSNIDNFLSCCKRYSETKTIMENIVTKEINACWETKKIAILLYGNLTEKQKLKVSKYFPIIVLTKMCDVPFPNNEEQKLYSEIIKNMLLGINNKSKHVLKKIAIIVTSALTIINSVSFTITQRMNAHERFDLYSEFLTLYPPLYYELLKHDYCLKNNYEFVKMINSYELNKSRTLFQNKTKIMVCVGDIKICFI